MKCRDTDKNTDNLSRLRSHHSITSSARASSVDGTDVAPRPIEAADETELDRIGADAKDDRN